ncbi:hypothetical protein KPL37_01045 [Clostridium frigoris]|uniref:Uncharacterized protein n=1 Tax=Clostridium frigoris TaxID=205327 RepID=A0ABS6BN56_9CLOT|nr:hypothetical protein [Clostridium frigoris]MBU3158359.1 hypothetical protein [Clostridium frigoris]
MINKRRTINCIRDKLIQRGYKITKARLEIKRTNVVLSGICKECEMKLQIRSHSNTTLNIKEYI